MNYAYVRVSTKTQKIDRQLEEIYTYIKDDNHIFIDKESGKNFERDSYRKLIKQLQKGDLVIIKSIDRLGRNYQMILEEWSYITKKIGADILVLDMPLLDTRTTQENLIGRLISDIVLQLLSFVAENERTNIKERQAEGIKIAKEKGIKFGRPKRMLPNNTVEIIELYRKNQINSKQAANLLSVSRGTFFRILKESYQE